ncbi:MAG: ABC transporter ATP-binding protein, partial [Actinobacteria bacterium]|nr:ABC transporter ATP-binding protein [Actinomycetota bacterium]
MRLSARFHDNLNLWFKLYQLLSLSSRRLSMMVAVLSLAEAVLGITLLYLVKRVVDVVSNQLDAVGRIADAGQVFLYFGLIGLLIVLTAAAQRLAEYARQRQGMEVADYVDRLIHERAVEVDLGFYESPAYHDSLERARAAGSERPAQVITTLAGLFRSFLFLAGVLVIVATLDWRLVPLLLASMVVALLVRLRFTSMLFHWRQRRTQKERRAAYLDWLLTSEHHAKELRIGQLGDELRDRYSRLRREIRGEQLEIEKRKMLAEVGAAAAAALVFLGASTWLVLRVIDGSMGLGDLVLFLLLFRRAETSGREFVSSLSMLYDHKLFLSQLFSFLDVTPRILAPAKPKSLPERAQQGIRFKGISFTYPTSDAPILSN